MNNCNLESHVGGTPQHWRPIVSLTSTCVLFTMLACSSGPNHGRPGSGDGDVASTETGDGDGNGNGTTSSTTTSGPVPDEVTGEDGITVDCTTLARPPTPLRRLTRFEYNNSVRDLFHSSLTPAQEFPPDEIADGFSNNALVLTISSLHAEKYTYAAEALAAETVTKLDTLLPCDPIAIGDKACATEFATSFGRQVFRRTLEAEDVSALMEAYAVGSSFEKGIEIMIRTMLQSPHFLFRVEFTGADVPGAGMVRLNGYEIATRLSYLIWSSTPDMILLDAAEKGELTTPEQVATQARRLLSDPKAGQALTEFYRQWLELSRLDITTKDPVAFPLWSDAMRAAMKEEGDVVLQDILFGEEPTLSKLLTAPLGLPKGPLAELYGVPESTEVTLLSGTERAGITTLPGFMAAHAHPDQTSPVLRGKFIRNKLLCDVVPPPPDNVDISTPAVVEGGTARERFSAHSADAFCSQCHSKMDPLGYPFESYDAIGRFRTSDGGQTMDLSGQFIETKAIDGPFDDVHGMLAVLADAKQVRDCVTSQWYKFAMGRGGEDGDVCSLTPLQSAFSQSGGDLLELVVSTTQTEAFLYRRAATEEVSP